MPRATYVHKSAKEARGRKRGGTDELWHARGNAAGHTMMTGAEDRAKNSRALEPELKILYLSVRAA